MAEQSTAPNDGSDTPPPPPQAIVEDKYIIPVSQNPGGFFFFWNVIVPFSIVFNIRRFGLRTHEIGLTIALLINPYIVRFLIKHPVLAWMAVIFLMIWIERILARWTWYKIYTVGFFRSAMFFILFLIVPSAVIKYMWQPFYYSIPGALTRIHPFLTPEQINNYRNAIMLLLASLLLMHALYVYSVCDGINISVKGRSKHKLKMFQNPPNGKNATYKRVAKPKSRDVFLEKHWKSVINKSICDYFFETQSKASNPEDIPPVIATPHHYLINIYRSNLYFVAVVTTEVPPLFVIEFLHRICDTFDDYFTECNESNLKENFVIVYELLDEMLDNGFPLAVESNVLKELIKPPNFLRTITDTVTGKSTGVSGTLPTGQLSNIPWRRTGVKYTNNEAYFDVIEEIDAIIDKSGSTVIAEIQGYIDCLIKLSGMPDLTLSFVNPRLLDDLSFHPCVRFKRWESDKVLSFVPPDGHFRMMSYHIGSNNMVAIPVYLRHNISYQEGSGGKFDVTIGPKQTMGKTVENVVLEVPFPKTVLNVTLTCSQGKNSFDPVSKLMTWDVGKIDPGKLPNIKGHITLQTGVPIPESNPTITVMFTINTLAVSGLKVNRLDMYGEEMEQENRFQNITFASVARRSQMKYKPFKGVKYITRAGKFQVRT